MPADKPPENGNEQERCLSCRSLRVKRETLISRFLYFRCEDCGYVWSIEKLDRERV